jgi:hypothetical protein
MLETITRRIEILRLSHDSLSRQQGLSSLSSSSARVGLGTEVERVRRDLTYALADHRDRSRNPAGVWLTNQINVAGLRPRSDFLSYKEIDGLRPEAARQPAKPAKISVFLGPKV